MSKAPKSPSRSTHAPSTAPQKANPAPDHGQGPGSAEIKRQPRVYKSTQEVDHDLFKLESAVMRKNVSFTDIPQIENFQHCHIFHTVDSSGRKQTTSTAVGGHHHDVEVVPGPDGVPTLKVSEPRRWVKRKIRGIVKRISVPIFLTDEDESGDRERDTHVHAVQYMGSERITLRQPNVEFAKFESEIKAKREPSIEGVIAR